MTPHIPPYFFIFDVESIGLHGEAFAVAGGVLHTGVGVFDSTFCFATHPDAARGTDDDRDWVSNNVPVLPNEFTSTEAVREAFWKLWMEAKTRFPGIQMAAECLWPVEARFVIACIADKPKERNWEGPYPFMEIASFMAAAGMDPMATYERLENELPTHDPRGDVAMSARLLQDAIEKLQNP
jgi:hypothetical protein